MSNANEENNELDDIFTTSDDSDANGDFFSSLNDSSNDVASPFDDFDASEPSDASPSPFDDFASEFSDSGSQSEMIDSLQPSDAFGGAADPFDSPQLPVDGEIGAEVADGKGKKKGKKEKAPKGKKEKTPKAKKAPKAKAPKSDVRYGSSKPFSVLGALFLLFVLAGNAFPFMDAAAFKAAGTNLIFYFVTFNILGAFLLAVPFLLMKQLRDRAVGLFDVFLGLTAAFLALAAMCYLAYQAKTYAWPPAKVASNVVVSSFDDRA